MSLTHVSLMNRKLTSSKAVQAEAAKLDRRYLLVYDLAQGKRTHWWQLSFDPAEGVTFSLEEPTQEPDLLLQGDYVEYIRFMKMMAAGEAEEADQPLTMIGDEKFMEKVKAAFEESRKAATVPIKFPDL